MRSPHDVELRVEHEEQLVQKGEEEGHGVVGGDLQQGGEKEGRGRGGRSGEVAQVKDSEAGGPQGGGPSECRAWIMSGGSRGAGRAG